MSRSINKSNFISVGTNWRRDIKIQSTISLKSTSLEPKPNAESVSCDHTITSFFHEAEPQRFGKIMK